MTTLQIHLINGYILFASMAFIILYLKHRINGTNFKFTDYLLILLQPIGLTLILLQTAITLFTYTHQRRYYKHTQEPLCKIQN